MKMVSDSQNYRSVFRNTKSHQMMIDEKIGNTDKNVNEHYTNIFKEGAGVKSTLSSGSS